MRVARWVGLAALVLAVALVGCLQAPDEAPPEPTVPGNDTLDLDPMLDAVSDPFGPLFRVDVSSGTGGAITANVTPAPWTVDGERIVHGHHANSTAGIALTTLGSDAPTTTLYNGTFSSAGSAKYLSADPARGHVYFSHDPTRNPPQIVRRSLEPGGE